MARKKTEIPEGHVKVYVEVTAQVAATVGAQVEGGCTSRGHAET